MLKADYWFLEAFWKLTFSLQSAWVWLESPASSPSLTRQNRFDCHNHFMMRFNIIWNNHLTGYTHTYCFIYMQSKKKWRLNFQGSTYGACTQAGSENGAAWCATQVTIYQCVLVVNIWKCLWCWQWTNMLISRLTKAERLWGTPGRIVTLPVLRWHICKCNTHPPHETHWTFFLNIQISLVSGGHPASLDIL